MALMRVRYKGLSDWRQMSVKDLAGVGIGINGDLLWDASNRKTIYIKDPSEDLLEIFKSEGTFNVEEVDEKGNPLPEGTPLIEHDVLRLDDTGATIVDVNSGQVSTKSGSDVDADALAAAQSEAEKKKKQ